MGFSVFPTFTNFLWAIRRKFPNEKFYEADLVWVKRADVVVVVEEGMEQSKGVQLEIECARQHGIPVCVGLSGFRGWLHDTEGWE